MSKFILLVVCAMAMFATTDAVCNEVEAGLSIAACQLKLAASPELSPSCVVSATQKCDYCKGVQGLLACFPKDCCDNMLYKTQAANMVKTAAGLTPACPAKCGAGAMATPAAALFAVVVSMLYRLM